MLGAAQQSSEPRSENSGLTLEQKVQTVESQTKCSGGICQIDFSFAEKLRFQRVAINGRQGQTA